VAIRGEVVKRPKGMENPKILGGEFEVVALKLEVLAQALPVPLDVTGDGADVGEEIRMKYRYLDLRRPRLQKNITLRADIISFMREYLRRTSAI